MSDAPQPQPHITLLRQQLLDTLQDLRNRENPMEPDRARAIAQVASVLVDTAKVEVDYLKATDQRSAPFLEAPPDPRFTPAGQAASPFPTSLPPSAPPVVQGVVGVRRHLVG